MSDIQSIVSLVATLIAITGGAIGLIKYFSDRRKSEVREWQKVIVEQILRENEDKSMSFTRLLDRYRSETQAFREADLTRKEKTDHFLKRVMIELVASGVVDQLARNSYRLRLAVPRPEEIGYRITMRVFDIVNRNPFVYTSDEVAKEIVDSFVEFGFGVSMLRTHITMLEQQGALSSDNEGRLGFPA